MMKTKLIPMTRLPVLPILAMTVGGIVLVWSWYSARNIPFDTFTIITPFFLIGGTIAAARFPIHLRQNTKLMMTTVPLFLMAALLPTPIAVLGVGAAMLSVGIMLQPHVGTTAPDIGSSTGRWMINAWLTSLATRAALEVTDVWLVALVAAALTMFVIEAIGSALEIAPVVGEPFELVLNSLLREGGISEGVQYVIAIGGALIAVYQVWALLLLILPLGLVYLGIKRAKEMQDSTRRVLEDLADAIDLRDPYTGGHSRRVSEACSRILQALSVIGPEADLIISASRVHDIGKIGMSDEILLKPGKLTPQERKQMEAHVEIGAQLLERYHDFARGREMVRHHHERWDGKGYPAGLKETQIPLGARIISVADSFDAMTSDRPYRPAFTVEHALRILQEGRGTQWDPRVVDIFLLLHGVEPTVALESTSLEPVRA